MCGAPSGQRLMLMATSERWLSFSGHLYYNAKVCVDVWSSVWATVDVDGRVRERVKLIAYSITPLCVGHFVYTVPPGFLFCDCCGLKCLMLRELFQKIAMKVAVFLRLLLRLQCERK